MKRDSKALVKDTAQLAQYHLQAGWWLLFFFLSLGLVLEGLHAFKIGWYLDVSNSTRRFMWTLAHAHGTLIGLLHLGLSVTISAFPSWEPGPRLLASRSLTGAAILMPLGFFLGGIYIYGGDPGLGAFLVPPGGVLLLVAVYLAARAAKAKARGAGG